MLRNNNNKARIKIINNDLFDPFTDATDYHTYNAGLKPEVQV